MSLPAPLRVIHTNTPSDGSPLIKEDHVELLRHGNMAHKPAFVQPSLVGDPQQAMEGGDRKADSDMSWICSTGVVCAWTGKQYRLFRQLRRASSLTWTGLDPGFGMEGPSKHFFYVGATGMYPSHILSSRSMFVANTADMTTVCKGQLTVIFKDESRKTLNPGDVFVNAAGIFRYENNGTETVREYLVRSPAS